MGGGNPMGSQGSVLGRGEVTPLTSAGAKAQLFPNFLAWASPSELGRSRRTTLAPFSTSRSAVARPRPEEPPVIMATRPCEEGSVNGYPVQTLSSACSPGFCKGGSRAPLQSDSAVPSLLTDGISRFLIPR